MGRVNVVVVSAACALLLAGCTSAPAGSPGPTASPTTSETAAPAPTPTDEGADDLSDPELGIVFEDVPELDGDAADVHNWIATYSTEYWRTMTTNEVSPAFDLIGSADVQATMQGIVDQNVSSQVDIAGVFHARVGDVVVEGDTARGTVCDDYRDVTFTDPNGTYTPDDVGFGEPRHKTLTLTRVPDEDRWLVLTSVVEGTC
ncbi:hypothetical protein [Cellulomonas terrae]|uniref:Lipoprotein n=1 Tax=Cellulomonas terrae TaxID=311234 RepID=A0A511JLP9_9CELL|nr:hypothetical protein [Cellulomonas terrae]GEL98886.1 hypothetical protein CTE05_24330 [Cellulomonas terrae]